MKRLATVAALVAVFAIPAFTSGLGLAETVPQGTVAVECSEWVFDSSPTDTGLKPLLTVD